MGIFVAISAPPDPSASENLYPQALQAGRNLFGRLPESTVSKNWCLATSFRRENGFGSGIATDVASGNWIAVAGTCFHSSGATAAEGLLKHAFSASLDQFAQSIHGFFAIVLGNSKTQELTVITDIIGSCHLYLRQISGHAILSTSSLLLASLAEVSLDPLSSQEFLGMGVIYEDRSLYREIQKLPAASVITFKDGVEVGRRSYWEPSRLSPESLTSAQATELLWNHLVSAATQIDNRFEGIVCDLTGGYDSRAMAAAFLGAERLFTTAVSGPSDTADVTISRGLAAKLGLQNLHSPPGEAPAFDDLRAAVQLTDGEYDVVEYSAITRIHRALSRNFQISINGSFGEVARGYWWELLFPHTGARQALDSHKLSAGRYAWNSANDLFQKQFQVNLVDHMAAVVTRNTADLAGSPNTFQMDVAYLRMRMQHWQGRIASSTDRIWPCLSPFMFRPVLETMLQSPHAARQRSLLIRQMLAKYQPVLAEYPLEHGYPAAPMSVGNFWRFWPLVPYYGQRVSLKLASRFATGKSAAKQESLSSRLWKMDEVREVLDTQRMRTSSVLAPQALISFLESSKQPGFSRQAEWNRLLSIEMAFSLGGQPKVTAP